MHGFSKTFKSVDERYMKVMNMTGQDLGMAIDRLNDIHTTFDNLNGVSRNHPSTSGIVKRSLLPFRNLTGFLFGTASNSDIKQLKKILKLFMIIRSSKVKFLMK